MKVLIAPDSFKDSLSATDVARALSRGFLKGIPDADIRILPMADGGEGTVESLMESTGGRKIKVRVSDPLMRKTEAFLGLSGDGTLGVIEMASASGLEKLKDEERNPWITTTYGTGELIKAALGEGCKRLLIGIGGSATNDGGAGMATALGIQFLDGSGKQIGQGGGALGDLEVINLVGLDRRLDDLEIMVACDVSNPLTGPQGASHVYGPQKGADPEMVRKLDSNLAHYARIIYEQMGIEIENIPGSGAAGGLGAGLMAFLGGRLMKGIEIVSEAVNLEDAIIEADIVITGEGKLDEQSLYGKTVYGISNIARKYSRPVIAVAGTIGKESAELLENGVTAIMPIIERPMDLKNALQDAAELLERCGERIARLISIKY